MVKRTEWIVNIATIVIAACALFVTAVRAKEFFKDDPSKPHKIGNWAAFSAEGHVMGPEDALVKIVEFADYQCPFCQQAEPVLRAIRARYPRDVSIIYRHFPLSIHDSAVAAARASECAESVGSFEEFHRQIFAHADSIGHQSWEWFALNAGVSNMESFKNCLKTQVVFPAITRDSIAGEQLGVEATPTFLVNEIEITGFLSLPELDRHVRKALDQARRKRD